LRRTTRCGKAVTALAIENIGKRRDANTGEHDRISDAAGSGCCGSAGTIDTKPCHHDTSRIAWAKLLAPVGEQFTLACPRFGGNTRLINFITDPGLSRKIRTHLGEPLDPPVVSPALGRRLTGVSWCSPRVLGSSSNHHRMICP
jgi:hypothetical protein